jgi:hypothetical protein
MGLFCLLKARNALVHIPAERSDAAHIVVEIHLAVGNNVETSLLLIVDRDLGCVVIRLLVGRFFERYADVPA